MLALAGRTIVERERYPESMNLGALVTEDKHAICSQMDSAVERREKEARRYRSNDALPEREG